MFNTPASRRIWIKDPDKTPRLIAPPREGVASIVMGNRFHGKVSPYRALGIRITQAVLRHVGVRVEDPKNGSRTLSRWVIEVFYPNLSRRGWEYPATSCSEIQGKV